ncbi:vacuolar ATPase assembly integral membrane protein VMA21 homolog [Schistocerca nitens]|uniref:vacuolar ATPase assembly integral membrane protein VMA21 homolog n=1 Tax=Schistocerca nitens TaxID=7011 RepID=UPI002118733A|nr:vacuolar ATPase assembly integral membrane protein VMA21 homolog [Schistocerca nitens]
MINRIPKGSSDIDIIRTVFMYCFGVMILPVATFFGVKYVIFNGFLSDDSIKANVYSAITAVIVLHISLVFFIIKAYSETEPPKPVTKRD